MRNLIAKIGGLFRSSNLESPSVGLTGQNITDWLGGRPETRSGQRVGVHDALSYSPVWSAVSLISEDIMRIPFLTYKQRVEDGKQVKEKAFRHPTFDLLTQSVAAFDEPGHMTTNVWLQLMMSHALLHKGAYSRIYMDPFSGHPKRLEWVHSDRVQSFREDGSVFYRVSYGPEDEPGHKEVERVPASQMFVINGMQLNELEGLSMVAYARNSLGRHISAEGFSDDFFKNLGVPMGFVRHPHRMSKDAQLNFMEGMKRLYGRGNRHKFGMLDEGMDWVPLSVNAKDALLIDMMQFGVPEVARWFKVPLHRLGDPSRTGYNTTEEDNNQFLNSTLGSWLNRFEMEANDKLFKQSEKRGRKYYTKFDVREYARANTKDRTLWAREGIQWGFLTRNEVREDDDRNPLPGLDEPLTPLNMTPGNEEPEPPAPNEPDVEPEDTNTNDNDRSLLTEKQLVALRDLLARDVERMARRLGNAAARAARKPDNFLAYVNELESEHQVVIDDALRGSLQAIEVFRPVQENVTARLIDHTRETMLTACECSREELKASIDAAAKDLITFSKTLANEVFFNEHANTN